MESLEKRAEKFAKEYKKLTEKYKVAIVPQNKLDLTIVDINKEEKK
jgi:hypothetical protein